MKRNAEHVLDAIRIIAAKGTDDEVNQMTSMLLEAGPPSDASVDVACERILELARSIVARAERPT